MGVTTPRSGKPHLWLLVLQSLGVIYGDIGTSPLYTISTIFANGDFTPNEQDIIGGVSLVIWTILILVSIKYIIFILVADNEGEGGTLALTALLIDNKSSLGSRSKKAVIIASLFGVGFIIADGFLTPAISVLSAIEGLIVFNDSLEKYSVVITIVIIAFLFIFQRFGTARVGFAFGPIMLLWFWSLTAIGWYRISQNWNVLKAFNPAEGFKFFLHHKTTSFLQLASVFLSVTGLEALYADLGHFGKPSIRISWLLVAQPAVISNYLGQGAFVINNPNAMSTLFFSSVPKPVYWPMLVLATLATIIASQAMITGCFSLVSQAVSLGFFPPVQIKHTSKKVAGQIFVPEVNYVIMLAVIGVVAGFKKSSAIADAYGVTVCGVMILTTVLYAMVMRFRWNSALWKVILFLLFLIVDFVFFSANLTKVPHGGWFSIVSGVLIAVILIAWFVGQEGVHHFLSTHVTEIDAKDIDKWASDTGSIGTMKRDKREVVTLDMIDVTHEKHLHISKVEGTGVFLTPIVSENAPQVFLNMALRTKSMPSRVVFLTVLQTNQPYVTHDPIEVKELNKDVIQVIIKTGFAEGKCVIEEKLKEIAELGYAKFVDEDATYYALRVHVKVISSWIPYRFVYAFYGILKRLFSGISHNIKTPHDSTVEVGILVPL